MIKRILSVTGTELHSSEKFDQFRMDTVNAYLEKCSAMYDIIRKSEEPLCIRAVAVRAYGREGKKMTDAERRSCILIWFKTAACLNYMKHRGLVKETITDGVSMWSV